MDIGEIIKNGRIKKGMTRKQMANVLGITTGALAHWENGIRYPSARDFVKLVKMLNIVTKIFPECAPKTQEVELQKKLTTLQNELNEQREKAQIQKNQIHILVLVEDSLSYITMAEAIGIFGYLVIQAKTKEEALKILKHNNNKIALMIIDQEFSEQGGCSLFELIRKNKDFSEIPVILYANKHLQRLPLKVDETGLLSILSKPFDIFKLSKVIDKINLEWQLKSK